MELNERKEFCKLIDAIEKYIKDSHKFSKKLSSLFDGEVHLELGDGLIDAILNYLRKKYKDEEDWIGYYCWELDFGEESYRLAAYIDDKEVRINNSKALFKVLKSRYKEVSN